MHIKNRILVRKTVEQDLKSIMEVRLAPEVKSQQYRVSMLDSPHVWKRLLDNQGFGFLSWTIHDGDSIVGHVMGQQKLTRGNKGCIMGWNLLPKHWGQGIMSRALIQVFEEIFALGTDEIIADRFEHNDRCGRLLKKFSFSETDIANFERFMIWMTQRCPHRIIRSTLDRETWSESVATLQHDTV